MYMYDVDTWADAVRDVTTPITEDDTWCSDIHSANK